MRKTSITRTSAAIFGATLMLGAAACSTDEAKDNANKATDAAEAANLGMFKSAEKAGDNVLSEFDNGWVVSSPDGGTHPIVGKIGETWNADGALDNEVGLPTDGEKEIEGGWEQPFTNGTIQWTQDEDGQFSAKYM